MKRLAVVGLVILGLARAAPSVLKRLWAPPRRPEPHTPAGLGLPEIPVVVRTRSGIDLHAWFIPVGGAAPAVVVLHGWGANASLMLPLAPSLHRAGFHSLFLDARNHGRSDHDDFVSMPRFAEDLETAVEWLGAHEDVTSIGVIGHSVGAGAALLVGSRRTDVEAIVSVSAFAHPAEAMAAGPPFSKVPPAMRIALFRTMERTIGARFDDIAPRATIGGVRAPIMLVHGDADGVVDIANLRELAVLRPDAETLVVPGADHGTLEAFAPYTGRILAFLARHLG